MGLKEDYLTLEDGANKLSQNLDKKLPLCAAWNPQRAQISFTVQHKPETLNGNSCDTRIDDTGRRLKSKGNKN